MMSISIYLPLVPSNALVASSCTSNWTNAKFFLILTFATLPYLSKCLSRSRILVLIGSKLITNKVLVGLALVGDLLKLPFRPALRSSCTNNEYDMTIQ